MGRWSHTLQYFQFEKNKIFKYRLLWVNTERGTFSEYGFKDLCELKNLKTLICGWSDIGGH